MQKVVLSLTRGVSPSLFTMLWLGLPPVGGDVCEIHNFYKHSLASLSEREQISFLNKKPPKGQGLRDCL